jgi:hypothetical protein
MNHTTVRSLLSTAAALFLAVLVVPPLFAQGAAATDPAFGCMTSGTKVRNTYISHSDPARLKEAVRIFENNVADVEYPEGTMLQLVPGEAMIKRSRSAFPNSSGWEFFLLDVTPQGSTVKMRGDTAGNRGGTCLGCHQRGVKFDFVCERTHGCAPVPLTDEQLARIQSNDPRCTQP